jgi:Uncharacterised nucleotidyltransferase
VKTGLTVSLEHANSAGSLEWRLLLAATAAEPGERDLSRVSSLLAAQEREQAIDWNSLLSLAVAHGTSSLLYQNLRRLNGMILATALESLRERHEGNLHKSLFLARELMRILDSAEALGIELMAYKGLVLAETHYGDMALRQTGDLDLFVRKEDVVRMKNAVRDLGYTPHNPVPEGSEKDYIASGYEYGFDGTAGNNLLELQWALQPRFYAVDLDMEGLFTRAVYADVGGRQVKTLAAEDLLIVLSLHAAKHVWGRIIWLCDIAQVLRGSNLDWDAVLSGAREIGILRILHVTMLLTNRFLGTPLPAPLESGIRGDHAAQDLAEEIAASVPEGISWDEPKISYFRLMMRLRERRLDRLRFLVRLTFTPGPGEWELIRLPRALTPLYRLVRLYRLAGRGVRGIFSS